MSWQGREWRCGGGGGGGGSSIRCMAGSVQLVISLTTHNIATRRRRHTYNIIYTVREPRADRLIVIINFFLFDLHFFFLRRIVVV